MKEDKITKRIKELQEDRRFTFKLTDDISRGFIERKERSG